MSLSQLTLQNEVTTLRLHQIVMSQQQPTAKWRVRKRPSQLLDLGRAIYRYHAQTTGDNWWQMAKRAEVSDNVVQRFLAVNGIQKIQTGRSLANVEAIFQAMGHELYAVPIEVRAEVQKIIDAHYLKGNPNGPDAHG